MSGNRVFFDSNILVYLYTETELAKKRQALLEFISNDRYISTQVLNELSNVGFKKLNLTVKEVQDISSELISVCYFSVVDYKTIQSAHVLKDRYGYSYYDCLMLASALECGCKYLYSEDMSDDQTIKGLTIRNIFRYP
ncbi:twitching motility protein PilT [Spirochaetia bacterium]|nr:twitching motility protein PilT [Spirochaetia bacterium]